MERRSGEVCARIAKVFGVTYRGHKKSKGSPQEGRPDPVCQAVSQAEGPHERCNDHSRALSAGVSTSYVSVPSLESSLARILTLLEDISSTARELVEGMKESKHHVGATSVAPERFTLQKVNRSADQTEATLSVDGETAAQSADQTGATLSVDGEIAARPTSRPSLKVKQPRVDNNPQARLAKLFDLAKA